MSDTRGKKVMRDVWLHKSRTLLVVLAITIGMAGAGTVLDTWALIRRVTREGYLGSDPAAATLRMDSVDATLLARVRALPGVRGAQARRTTSAAVRTPAGRRSAILFTVDDFSAVTIGRLKPEVGAWPPADGALIIERSSLDFSGASVGESVELAAGGGAALDLAVTGVTRDVGLAPGWMEHIVYGYVTRATLGRLGAASSLNELQIVVAPGVTDRDSVRRIAFDVKAAVEASGQRVHGVEVPEPGRHVHAGQMDSLLYTQGAFGLMALLLSAFLVVNLVAAMLAGQVREIGVMKTLGARPGQIVVMYLGLALVLGIAATLLALPIAAWTGYRYAELKAELLNFDLTGYAIPWWAILIQVLVGALLPVAAAALPVLRGCRIPVGEALRDVGISAGRHDSAGPLSRVSGVARPLLFSLRNAFRRRQRMILTLLALSTGGAVYLGALNLRASVRGAVDLLYEPLRLDFTLRLAEGVPPDSVESVVRRVAGVASAEAWTAARASVVHEGGTLGDAFTISAMPLASAMVVYEAVDGRWLAAGDGNALVVNRSLLADEPGLAAGSRVRLMLGGTESAWTIVGLVEAGPSHLAFAPRATIAALNGGRVDRVVVKSSVEGPAAQVELIQRLRGELERAGMPVQSSQVVTEGRRALEDHMLMVADFLGAMAWLMILVGGLGLASTMSLAVLERTREIGVLRAIGARHRSILGIVQAEGLVIAILSWLIAIPLSVPMSLALGAAFGRIMLPLPPRYFPEWSAIGIWLGVVVAASVLACAWPAYRAMRVPVSAALAYE